MAVNPAHAEKPGLDPKVLDKFPTFTYSVVKQYRQPKSGGDCAICLLEFQDNHVLRLLTICTHVFHQNCVDIWFKMHKTCPACRRHLELPADEATLPPDLVGHSVSITIKDDHHEQKKKKSLFRSKSRETYEDRFTLQIPDHVTQELLKGTYLPKNLDRSGSFGQGSDGNV
ncbi:RING-H2 finger protein ATL30-like [Apium graveolens]|uniref:RING-H2 finger protein ATL30-like n=1 Tax=Apium graveolens TaxID=4045 RepID=UPI003D7BD746